MVEPTNPYAVTVVATIDSSVRQTIWPSVLGAFFILLLNAILGAMNSGSDLQAFTKWGIYAGEYVALVTWFTWGNGSLIGRLALVAWLGTAWMLSVWCGYGIARGTPAAFAYSTEFRYVFNVIPLAFLLSSIPMLCLSKWWAFQTTEARQKRPTLLIASLIPIVVSIGLAYMKTTDLAWEFFYSVVIGIVLGSLAAVTAPTLSIAILGDYIKPRFIMLAAVAACTPGIFARWSFSRPRPRSRWYGNAFGGVNSWWRRSVCNPDRGVLILAKQRNPNSGTPWKMIARGHSSNLTLKTLRLKMRKI